MLAIGWIVSGILVLLGVIGIYKILRLGRYAIKFFGLQVLLAGAGSFLSYTALTAILGKNFFKGYSFVSLSLTLALPYFMGVTNQWINHRFLKRRR